MSPLSLTTTPTVLIDLFGFLGATNAEGDSQITLGVSARIMGTATVVLVNDAVVPILATCSLLFSNGSGPASGLTQDGESSIVSVPPGGTANVTAVGTAVRPAGLTYNVVVACSAASHGVEFERGNLLVWAISATAP